MKARLGWGGALSDLTHEGVLRRALRGGITLLDTSASFAKGQSESLIGQVLSNPAQGETFDRSTVTVMSKFGYAAAAQGSQSIPGAVPVVPGVMHSMHPGFLAQEFEQSRQRLRGFVDVYMVHNPETQISYYLGKMQEEAGMKPEEPPSGTMVENARSHVWQMLVPLFEGLEIMVSQRKIRGYGVSSHALSLPENDPLHISWERLLECAEKAAMRAGKGTHSLTTMQMPGNLMETEGLKQAPGMKSAGLDTVITRALTVMTPETEFLLVHSPDSAPPASYMDVCGEALEHFRFEPPENREMSQEELDTLKGCQWVQQLIQDMNRQLVDFKSFSHFEENLAQSILPMLDRKFDCLDEGSMDRLKAFFDIYGAMVKYHCSEKVSAQVRSAFPIPATMKVQEYALNWALNQEGVSAVLVSMRKEQHLDENLEAVKNIIGQ
ncbi:unnamed protein product [Chrysoparadoxa australica]